MNLKLLRKIASNSDHKLNCHCSIILAGNRLLATGYNVREIHAEDNAIRHLDRIYRPGNSRRNIRSLHLVSFMVKRKNNRVGNSFPCPYCMDKISRAGIRTVTYFNSNGLVQQIKLVN